MGFHTLCNHPQAKPASHRGYGLQDTGISRILMIGCIQKFHIDFQNIQFNVRQHVQGGISTAKIIHQNGEAACPQFIYSGNQLIEILSVGTFRYLYFQKPGWYFVFFY